MESGAGFNLYSMAEAQHLCYGFNAPRQLENNYRDVLGTIYRRTDGEELQSTVNSMNKLLVRLFDVYEHNSGQFVWVLVEKTPTTTHNDLFSSIFCH